MAIQIKDFDIQDIHKDTIQVLITEKFTNEETEAFRDLMEEQLKEKSDIIYLDLRELTEIDLSGVNEIIHTHEKMKLLNKELVVIYTKGGFFEEWLSNTKLDFFVSTAMVPASLVYKAKDSGSTNLEL